MDFVKAAIGKVVGEGGGLGVTFKVVSLYLLLMVIRCYDDRSYDWIKSGVGTSY